jgi:hypothetical protein
MNDLYAVIRRERELRLRDVERQRALGLIESGRRLRGPRADDPVRLGKAIAWLTHRRIGQTGPRPISPR